VNLTTLVVEATGMLDKPSTHLLLYCSRSSLNFNASDGIHGHHIHLWWTTNPSQQGARRGKNRNHRIMTTTAHFEIQSAICHRKPSHATPRKHRRPSPGIGPDPLT
jgi:hypothetical protein